MGKYDHITPEILDRGELRQKITVLCDFPEPDGFNYRADRELDKILLELFNAKSHDVVRDYFKSYHFRDLKNGPEKKKGYFVRNLLEHMDVRCSGCEGLNLKGIRSFVVIHASSGSNSSSYFWMNMTAEEVESLILSKIDTGQELEKRVQEARGLLEEALSKVVPILDPTEIKGAVDTAVIQYTMGI